MPGHKHVDYRGRKTRPQNVVEQLSIEVSVDVCPTKCENSVLGVHFIQFHQLLIKVHLPVCYIVFLLKLSITHVFVSCPIHFYWASCNEQEPSHLGLSVESVVILRE
jgi:hypothetical protein